MKFITLLICFFCTYLYSKAQIISENDTLYLNYSISPGGMYGYNEGIMFYNSNNKLKAKCIRYKKNYGSIQKDSIIKFYEKNKYNYIIIKEEWVLSVKQQEYVAKLLDEIRAKLVEKNVFNTGAEHYAIISKTEYYVFIDRTGKWNKFLEIKRILDIENYPKKL